MLVLVLFAVIAFAQVVLSDSSKFTFTFDGDIEQCKPVSIIFKNTEKANELPVNLTLIPFNSKPFFIPIPPNAAASTSGVSITFLPLAAGTQFVASLDDSFGDNSARVSDIFRVTNSSDGVVDSSCLPTPPVQARPSFTLLSTEASVSQCETFQVEYAIGQRAPTLRSYAPKGGSSTFNKTADDTDNGIATYMMSKKRGDQAVLMMYDTNNPEAGVTSPLITVAGGAFSSDDCLVKNNSSSGSNGNNNSREPSIRRGVVIGLSVGGGIILIISILLAIHYIRQRRRRHQRDAMAFNPSLLEKSSANIAYGGYRTPPPPFSGSKAGGFVVNPIYTSEKYDDAGSYHHSSSSISSWLPETELPKLRRGPSQTTAQSMVQQTTHLSINPVDIERMLDYAASGPQVSPRPTVGRHQLSPSDVPMDPHSVAISTVSNPFQTAFDSPIIPNSNSKHLSFASSADFEIVNPPPAARLPASPLRKTPTSRFSVASIGDDSIIGGFPKPPFAKPSTPRDSVESWGNVTGVAR